MSITRYFPPRNEQKTKHLAMERGQRGPFVLYRDHLEKMAHKEAEIRALEARIEELGKDSGGLMDVMKDILDGALS